MKHNEQAQPLDQSAQRDNSMFTIGDELEGHLSRGRTRGQRGKRGRGQPLESESVDFIGNCTTASIKAVKAALMTRTAAALDYLAQVIDEIEQDPHLCVNVLYSMANSPELFPYITVVKRQCLLTKEFTHIIVCRTTFLPDRVRACVRGSSEIEVKQAANVALIGSLCRKLLLLDQDEMPLSP